MLKIMNKYWEGSYYYTKLRPLLKRPGLDGDGLYFVDLFQTEILTDDAFCAKHFDLVHFSVLSGKLLVENAGQNSILYHALHISLVESLKTLGKAYKKAKN